jgi:ssDNA-binding Zn-finger/Zn-ribbon topoisomerase 1
MYTQEQIIEKFKQIHGEKYDYSKVIFEKSTVKVCIICPEHGEFYQTPHEHLRGRGCPKCGVISRSKNRTNNTNKFLEKAFLVHGDKYDYSNVNYINNITKVEIKCPIHGLFYQTPHAHLQGYGCPKCGNLDKGVKMTLNEFKNRAKDIHNNYYNYDKTSYVNSITPVVITCPIHGDFKQTPSVHLAGHGCPKCGKFNMALKQTKTTEKFIEEAKLIHGNKYDYSKTIYKRCDIPVTIICPEHGEFKQKPINHLDGCGCQKCSMLFSNYELELGDFIESIVGKENVIRNDRSVLNGNELDIYIPSKNIAFEFNGIYWHSEVRITDKNYHLNKTNICLKQNIQLIHIFEDEWVNKNEICKSRIKNLLNDSKRIFARKCIIETVDNNTAKIFFNQNHIQGNVNSKIIYGLKFNNEYVAMMSFGPTRKNLGQKKSEGSYELLRFCNKLDYNVIGGASKLFKHFIKNNNPFEVITYADRRWSNGNLYEKMNMEFSHISQPNYFYIVNGERKNRFGYRKDILMSKYGCSPDDTEHNFCYNKGWYRIYDCGTKVYKWKKER